MHAIWASSAQQLKQGFDQTQQRSYAVVLDDVFASKYSQDKGIYLVTLFMAVVLEKQAITDMNTLRSDQLRSGTIEIAEDVVILTPKVIEQEFIKLNWSLKQMTYFSLRVRRWLSERKKPTVDGIGRNLYLILKDMNHQANQIKLHN